MTRHHTPGRGRDEGSAAIEAAVTVPALVLLVLLALTAGRIAMAGQAVDSAAEDAARDASIARNPSQAAAAAAASAQQSLAQQGLHCTSAPSVKVRVQMGPVGTGGTVTATVVCNVALSDLAFPGAPGTHTVSRSFVSAIDRFVERR